MTYDCKTDETKLVRINDTCIERVWGKGEGKYFKLMGINIDKDLKQTQHINHVAKKLNSANYALAKSSKELDVRNKKILQSGIIH